MRVIIKILLASLIILSSCEYRYKKIYTTTDLDSSYFKVHKYGNKLYLYISTKHFNDTLRMIQHNNDYVYEHDTSCVIMSNSRNREGWLDEWIRPKMPLYIKTMELSKNTFITKVYSKIGVGKPYIYIYYDSKYNISKIQYWCFLKYAIHPQINLNHVEMEAHDTYRPVANVKSFTIEKKANHINIIYNLNNRVLNLRLYKNKNSYYTDDFGIKKMRFMSVEAECDTVFKTPQKYGMVRLCIKKENEDIFSTFIPGGVKICNMGNINHCIEKYPILPHLKQDDTNYTNIKIFYDLNSAA